MSEFRRRLMMTKSGSSSLPNYLCFTALEDGTFSLTIRSNITTANLSYVEYSTDGNNWIRTYNVNSTEIVVTTPSISAGDKVFWRGSGTTLGTALSNNKWCTFSSTGKYDVSGCVSSLLSPANFENVSASSNYGMVRLFQNSFVVDAKFLELPSFDKTYMFYEFFRDCPYLLTAPEELSMTTLTDRCYAYMFYGCTSLISAPRLPATFLTGYCYSNMFYGCTSLTNAPDINVSSITGAYNMQSMFQGCASLVHCPIKSFPSTTTEGCLAEAFCGCTNLEDICDLPAETLYNYSYRQLVRGTKVTYIKMLATTITNSSLTNWVLRLPANGIFVKHINATWTNTGNSGVPNNWTIIYYDPALDKYYTDQTRATECNDHGNPL